MACNITQNDNYNTPTYSQNESASHYTEYEMEKYTYFMEYVEEEVDKALIPKHIKKEMMEKRHLHKDSESWFLYESGGVIGYTVRFLPFRNWLTQTERDKKLSQLGI